MKQTRRPSHDHSFNTVASSSVGRAEWLKAACTHHSPALWYRFANTIIIYTLLIKNVRLMDFAVDSNLPKCDDMQHAVEHEFDCDNNCHYWTTWKSSKWNCQRNLYMTSKRVNSLGRLLLLAQFKSGADLFDPEFQEAHLFPVLLENQEIPEMWKKQQNIQAIYATLTVYIAFHILYLIQKPHFYILHSKQTFLTNGCM